MSGLGVGSNGTGRRRARGAIGWLVAAMLGVLAAAPAWARGGSAVFLHPDGMGANTWAGVRLATVGPDGRLAWDGLERTGVYVGPLLDQVSATSNGGGTSHAWGVRSDAGGFGTVGGAPIMASASGADAPLMVEARRAGKKIGIVSSASVTDAGTGTQLTVAVSRRDHEAIAAGMLASRPDVLMGGGEQWFLPLGVAGVHGPGRRSDGRNLIEEARAQGYRIVRTRAEFAGLGSYRGRVLALFASGNTFNEGSEERLAELGLPLFHAGAPRFDEMVSSALKLLADGTRGFYLMAEEEATDNFAGDNNAAGVLEAGAGADRAIAVVRAFMARRRDVTLVVASDSDCGGMQATGDDIAVDAPLPERLENGSPLDGVGGARGRPFLAAPNALGVRLPFAIAWASDGDMSGGGVVRAAGAAAAGLPATVDSTGIFVILHRALFGVGRQRDARPAPG
jgi:alkaline phosphatase